MNHIGPLYVQVADGESEDLGIGFSLVTLASGGDPEDPITGAVLADLVVYVVNDAGDPNTPGTPAALSSGALTELDSTNMPGTYHLLIPSANLPTEEAHWIMHIGWNSGGSVAEFTPIVVNIYFKEMGWSALAEIAGRILQGTERIRNTMGV